MSVFTILTEMSMSFNTIKSLTVLKFTFSFSLVIHEVVLTKSTILVKRLVELLLGLNGLTVKYLVDLTFVSVLQSVIEEHSVSILTNITIVHIVIHDFTESEIRDLDTTHLVLGELVSLFTLVTNSSTVLVVPAVSKNTLELLELVIEDEPTLASVTSQLAMNREPTRGFLIQSQTIVDHQRTSVSLTFLYTVSSEYTVVLLTLYTVSVVIGDYLAKLEVGSQNTIHRISN